MSWSVRTSLKLVIYLFIFSLTFVKRHKAPEFREHTIQEGAGSIKYLLQVFKISGTKNYQDYT